MYLGVFVYVLLNEKNVQFYHLSGQIINLYWLQNELQYIFQGGQCPPCLVRGWAIAPSAHPLPALLTVSLDVSYTDNSSNETKRSYHIVIDSEMLAILKYL